MLRVELNRQEEAFLWLVDQVLNVDRELNKHQEGYKQDNRVLAADSQAQVDIPTAKHLTRQEVQ